MSYCYTTNHKSTNLATYVAQAHGVSKLRHMKTIERARNLEMHLKCALLI